MLNLMAKKTKMDKNTGKTLIDEAEREIQKIEKNPRNKPETPDPDREPLEEEATEPDGPREYLDNRLAPQ